MKRTRGVLVHIGLKQLDALDRKAKEADKSRSAYLRGLIAEDTGEEDTLPSNRWGQGRK